MRRQFETVAMAAGVLVLIVGTFAPWLRSGQVSRNSYRTAGLFKRLLDLPGAAGVAISAMPLLAGICAVGLATFLLGGRRSSAALLGVVALLVGALGIAVLLAPAGQGITAIAAGPVLCLVGAIATLTSTASVFLHRVDRGEDTSPQLGWDSRYGRFGQ